MFLQQGFETLPGAEGFHFRIDPAPTKVPGYFRQRHLLQMQQSQQRTVFRRQMGEQKLRLTQSIPPLFLGTRISGESVQRVQSAR